MSIDIIKSNSLELINDDTDEAVASQVSKNPFVKWMKFILLDDLPNENKHRIPREEFDNIISTGVHMPLKVEAGKTNGNHLLSFPIGVISNLMIEGNRIIGLAALWEKERPEDVALLKESFDKGEKLNISWELTYSDEKENDNYNDLLGVSLSAATLVGMPAYAGRTPVVALAEANNTSEEDLNLEELDTIKQERDTLAQAKTALETKVSELETALNEKTTLLQTTQSELDELKAFKQSIEDAKAEKSKLDSIKTKFNEAGLDLDENYFIEKKANLLALSEESIDFLIQETLAFKKATEASILNNTKVPRINLSNSGELSPKSIGEALRKLETKENK